MTGFIDEALLDPASITYNTQSGPATMVDIVTSAVGFEQRNLLTAWPRHKFTVIVFNENDYVARLRAAYMVCRGPLVGFRFLDPGDYTTAPDGHSAATAGDHALGAGDGATTIFELHKYYSFGPMTVARRIVKPVAGTVKVQVNGVATTSGWTLDTARGRITFASPPAAGTALRWGGQFDVPVRFDVGADGGGWRALMQTFSDYGVSDLSVDLIELTPEQVLEDAV